MASPHRYFEGGCYRFRVKVDNGVRVWVDDTLILDQWRDTSVRTYTVDVDVSAGAHQIKIGYYERERNAVCKVWWTQR